MAIAPNNPRLTLRFVDKSKPELRATEFSPPKVMGEQSPPNLCTEGKSGEGQFEWREGVQSLCICLIRYLCYPKSNLEKGIKFQFVGGKSHPAKTMDGNVAKANKANCWQQNVFGFDREGSCLIKKYIKRKNPNPTAKNSNFLLEIQHDELPQESIVVEVDDFKIIDVAELESLADAIEDQWFKINPQFKSEWAKIKDARKLRVDENRKILELPNTPQRNTSPVELFKSASVTSICSHITAALLPERGREAVEKSLTEILSPECLNVIAEKIVDGSIDDFSNFFYKDHDEQSKIKKCVAAVITSNKELRAKIADKVAKGGFRDMLSWFQTFSSFICDRQIVVDVEHAFMAASEDPGFKEKFMIYSPDHFTPLIEYFGRHNCVNVCLFFGRLSAEIIGSPLNKERLFR